VGDLVDRSQWLEIDAGALRHNLSVFRGILSHGTRIAAVVKANAYGHGLAEVAPVAGASADWLAVHTAEEARRLRRLGLRNPILIMGFIAPGEIRDLDADVHVFVSTEELLGWMGDYRRSSGISLPIHLKIDTGTKRQGFDRSRVTEVCRRAAAEGLSIVGIATHFANIEDTLEHDFARRQLDLFADAVATLGRELGSNVPYVHAACSAASLLFRETDFNLARIGISMYGHWPSRETRLTWILDHGRDGVKLEPSLEWRTVIGQLQRVATGETVGYGRTWRALRPTVLAVLPVGYADGYPRALGNRARVLAGGHPVPVVGRVCMNMMMVDVTDVPGAGVGDEVVLLGRQGESAVTVEELAELSGTINYEFLSRLSPAIPRIVVREPHMAPTP
jgi:alanine racemase